MLAPITSARASLGSTSPAPANDITSSTTDRLEWTNQVASVASRTATTYSSWRPCSAAMKAGEARSGWVASASSFSDSSIRPRPMATRPRWRERTWSLDRKVMTPAPIRVGETQPRSKESTCAATVVPTSAPSMTASAIDRGMSPLPAKEESSKAVAVLDCSRPVMASPPAKAVKRLREQVAMARRSVAPKARVRPVRTMRTLHSSRHTLPRTFRMVSTPCMIGQAYASLRRG